MFLISPLYIRCGVEEGVGRDRLLPFWASTSGSLLKLGRPAWTVNEAKCDISGTVS